MKQYIKQCYHTVWSVEKIQKVKTQNCAMCDIKKSKLIKEQEASGLLSSIECRGVIAPPEM